MVCELLHACDDTSLRTVATAISVQIGGAHHALGNLHRRDLCGRNLSDPFGVVAGVTSVHAQTLNTLNRHTPSVSQEDRAVQPRLTPFELLLIPYRNRLSHLRQREQSEIDACPALPKPLSSKG